ncbi:MAG: YdjY domain-containing protein [Planctomycetota bacterium]
MIAPAIFIASATLLVQPEGRVDAFPGIIVDYDARAIELAGFVPVDAHSEETPEVIVEVVAEAGGVRDHEALVRIEAEARHVHAALLLLGLEPGTPGAILNEGTRREPEGPELIVTVRYETDGESIEESPLEWVHAPDAGTRLIDASPGFRFTGSSEREFDGATYYMAEAEGVVVGLSTFGAGDAESTVGIETVGMTPVYNPDIASGDPIWLVDAERIPTFETRVTLVLSVPE